MVDPSPDAAPDSTPFLGAFRAAGAPNTDASPGDAPLLVADVGSVYTKIYLLDDVEGERRLVAVGRVPTAGDDGAPAVDRALAQALAQVWAHAGPAVEERVRARVALGSAAAVPRIAVLAGREEDARAVAQALGRLAVRVLEPLPTGGSGDVAERLLAHFESSNPDAAVVVCGPREADRRQALAALEVVRHGLGEQAPVLVLVGDDAFAAAAEGALGDTPFLTVPGLDGRQVSGAVAQVLADHAARGARGADVLSGWETHAPLGSLAGIVSATETIAERYDVDVLTLDLGASHAMGVLVVSADGRRRVTAACRDDLGLRLGRNHLLATAGADGITRWLPIDLAEDTLRAEARRGAIVPAAIPESVDDLLLDHAYAREALRLVLAEPGLSQRDGALPPIDLLIGSGGVLAGVPRLMQAVMILLDAVQPEALTQLALDRATALPLLGHLATSRGPAAVGAALERDGLLNLGLCIAPIGTGREGEPALKVEVAYATRSPITVEVSFGAIEVVPLPLGERAALKLWPERDFDVGLGKGNAATPRAEVEGGAVGIVIDARGRPLALPEAPAKRQAKLLQWLQSTRAYPQLSFVQEDGGGPGRRPAGQAGGA